MGDLREKARQLEIDVKEYLTLASMFLASARADIESIDRSAHAGDFPAVERSAHSLKGASSMLDLTEIQNEVVLIAERARAADRQGIVRGLEKVRHAIDDLDALLHEADGTENAKGTEDTHR